MRIQLTRRRDIVAAAVLLAGLGSCASASAVRLGAAVFPARPAAHPIVLLEDGRVTRAHQRIGRVVGEGSDLITFAGIVEAMRVEARRLGGDAIILLGGSLLWSGGGGECETFHVDRTVHGAVIRWL